MDDASGTYVFPFLEVYDSATKSWTAKAPMPTNRYGAVTGVIDGKLYVVGGWPSDRMSDLLIYTP